jgi:hypothetical protein
MRRPAPAGLLLLLCGCADRWCARFNLDCEPDAALPGELVDADLDGWVEGDDCDDLDALAFPGASEQCNQADDDCDGEIDEGWPAWATLYEDADRDGYGAAVAAEGCLEPSALEAATGGDCNDGNPASHPGAEERCDGEDNDCDGTVDDADLDSPPVDRVAFCPDADQDGAAAEDAADCFLACLSLVTPGYSPEGGDCDDLDPSRSPSAPEVCAEGVDQDCDGADEVGWCDDLALADAAGVVEGLGPAGSVPFEVVILGTASGAARLVVAEPTADAVALGPAPLEGAQALDALGTTWTAPAGSAAGSTLATVAEGGTEALLVGLPGWTRDGAQVGAVVLLWEPAVGGGAIFEGGAAWESRDADEGWGMGFAAADLDADGRVDLAFAGQGSTAGRSRVRVARSILDAPARIDEGWQIAAGEQDLALGRQVLADDLDGDGLIDLLVASVTADTDSVNEVLYGFAGPLDGDVAAADADWGFEAPLYESPRLRVERLGDHDGDGAADLALSVRRADGHLNGALAVFTSPERLAGGLGEALGRVIATSDTELLSADAAYLPDLDGDGTDELVVGHSGHDLGLGRVVLFLGPVSGTAVADDADRSLVGEDPRAALGVLLPPTRDLDGDGGADLLVGTHPPADAAAPSLYFFPLPY